MFSIIVPIYNSETYLRECIDSVINQTYSEWELLLINDGSTDNSAQICKEYTYSDKRIKYYFKENGGLVSARKTGIINASFQYVLNLDSDDILNIELLEKLKLIIDRDSPDVICFDICEFYENKKNIFIRKNSFPEGMYLGVQQDLIKKNYLCRRDKEFYTPGLIYGIVTKAVKKELLLNAQFCVPDIISIGEDLAVTSALLNMCNGIYIYHFVGYQYRQIISSLSRNVKSDIIDELIQLISLLKKNNEKQLWKNEFEEQISLYVAFRVQNYIAALVNKENLLSAVLRVKRIKKEVWKIMPQKIYKSFGVKHKILLWLLKNRIILPMAIYYKMRNNK